MRVKRCSDDDANQTIKQPIFFDLAVQPRARRHFAHLKHWQGYRRVRYRGLAKNQLELTVKAVAYNLKRLSPPPAICN
jgi:hypothetical protein